MLENILSQIETPALLIDMSRVKHNLKKMAELCETNHVALRPHTKTHKIPELARLQVAYGAQGITCAKVTEAEVMADGGLDDIFIAYPLVGEFRIRRAAALTRRIRRLILAVDSLPGAQALSAAAVAGGVSFEVRLEVDTGARRTGVPMDQAVQIAREIHALPGLRLTGIYTFKSLVLHNQNTTDNAQAGEEEGMLMERMAQQLRAAGIPIADVSAGSSPTAESVAKTGRVTEIRPGTYIFKDYMLHEEGVAEWDEIAAMIVTTVVSTPYPEYAVVDGGTKVFTSDIVPNTPPYYYEGYAKPVGNDDLVLQRINEEHGMLYSKSGNTGLKVGDKVLFYPGHVCPCVNLQNYVYLMEGDSLRRVRVEGRGMLV